jgi:multiple sugar transport system ATP-binding protein
VASVVLKHLDKKFPNGVHAVRELRLEIADGEFIVVVGPSGCGKSTTLRMVAGLEQPTLGEIYIGDRLVNNVPPGMRDIAMVFQNHALYPHMSVYQNMAFGLKMRRTPRAEIDQRVRRTAEILSIEPLLQRRPRELSGGQQQRVALGRAIVREPKVFLFDEPLSNLDAKLRVQMRAEIARLHRRLKTTIIYVTHDQMEAMTLGDRIVLMDHGEIQQIDTATNIYRRPANRFVASFIGSPAMNFFAGEVRGGMFHVETQPKVHGLGGGEVIVDAHFISHGENEQRFAPPLIVDSPPTHEISVGAAIPDGPAVLGVRPEDLVTCEDGAPFATVTLDMLEHLGHETIAHFSLAGFEHLARLPTGARVQPGDKLPLTIRRDAFHLFSADGCRRLN